jgi:hypothetical protein
MSRVGQFFDAHASDYMSRDILCGADRIRVGKGLCSDYASFAGFASHSACRHALRQILRKDSADAAVLGCHCRCRHYQ